MSFLGGVFGGGNIGGIIGGMIGGPIGSMVGNVVGQLASSVLDDVIQQVGKELGLPQTIIDAAQTAAQGAMGNAEGVAENLNDLKSDLQQLMKPTDFADLEKSVDDLKDALMKFMHEAQSSGSDEAEETNGSKKKETSGSADFFIAMAKAMGSALQDQADKVKNLSDKIAEQDTKSEDGKDELMKLQTELTGESTRMNYMATAIQNALKNVGQALSTMGRGQ